MIQLKNDREIDMIRKSGKVLAECLLSLDEVITEGISTYDIDRIAHEFIVKHHGYPSCLGYCGYPNATCTSVNEVVIHGIPSKKKILKNGDIISVDICVTLDGYVSDSTRTYEVGKVSDEVHKLNVVTRECLYKGIDAARQPHARLSEISKAVFKHAFTDNGYGVVRDYTGHGVGFFLNVHEGPNSISSRNAQTPLIENMITSIEPGYYKENHYGIRIENMARVISCNNPEFELPMLGFETLTLVPLDKKLIDKYLLTREEQDWLNHYHQQVFEQLSPLLNPQEQSWLRQACAPLD